jgi:spore coat polysaccharide biosynthesis protein SpsF
MNKNIDIIVQARFGSTRLPGKVMKLLEDKIVLEHVINRLRKSKYARNIIVCTSNLEQDNIIFDFCKDNHILCFRGSEQNVLERYYETAKYFESEYIVRVTSDCPLVDIKFIDLMIERYFELNLDYLGPKYYGNHMFPDGFNGEIFKTELLEEAYKNANIHEIEHVTTYIIKKYKTIEYDYPIDYKKYKNIDFSNLHLSLDTRDDYILLTQIYKDVYKIKNNFALEDVLDYLDKYISI